MKEDDANDLDECSNFAKVMGAFGSHSDIKRRTKAERLAAMKPGDSRRKRSDRTHQFNVRVGQATKALIDNLIQRLSERDSRHWSQADLIEAAMAALGETIGGASS
jgi:hypothetical protein